MSELVTRFEMVRRDAPSRILVHAPGAGLEWSAEALWQAHQRYAGHLEQMDVGTGDLVLSAAGNTAASVALLLACRAVDASLLPADSGTALPELLTLADRFGAVALCLPEAVVVADPRLDAERIIRLDGGLCLCPARGLNRRGYAGSAVLKLTSGSTDTPRVAITSEAQLIADSTRIAAAMGITAADVQMATIPISHAYGLGNLVLPLLLQGTPIVLHDSFAPHQLLADARRFGARVLQGVPFMFQFFLSTPGVAWPDSLTWLISAGAPLQPATVHAFHQRFGLKIRSFYGTSEAGGIAFDGGDEIDGSGTVGAPLSGVTVTLRDEDDIKGRIHVASTGVADGYSDGPDDAFTRDGFLTGDYGSWDDKGRLVLAGRVSSFVNVAGQKVQPDEVEKVLRGMPGVADVRVVGAHDPRRGEQIVACIVAERTGTIPAIAVRRYCAGRLAPHKIPRTIVFLETIPTTARGKVDRAALWGLFARNSAYNARDGMAIARTCVETPRNQSDGWSQGAVARVPGRQPACRRQGVPAQMGGCPAAQEPRAHVTTAGLATDDRFALPDLRPRNACADSLRTPDARVARQRTRRRDQGAHRRARRQGRHREDLPDPRHASSTRWPINPAFLRRLESLFPGRDFPAVTETLHNHGTSSIKYGRGAVLTIDLTNRCNMMCDPCFMDANQVGYVHELTLPEVEKLLDDAISIKPRRQMTVQFSGGEPTISPHLPRRGPLRAQGRLLQRAGGHQRHPVRAGARLRAAGARTPACGSPTCSSTASPKSPTPTARSATCST